MKRNEQQKREVLFWFFFSSQSSNTLHYEIVNTKTNLIMIKYELIYIFSMHMHLFPPRRDTHAFPLSHQNDNPDPARVELFLQ